MRWVMPKYLKDRGYWIFNAFLVGFFAAVDFFVFGKFVALKGWLIGMVIAVPIVLVRDQFKRRKSE